jgi:hypothetical protein
MGLLGAALFLSGLVMLLVSNFSGVQDRWPKARYLTFHYLSLLAILAGAWLALSLLAEYPGGEASAARETAPSQQEGPGRPTALAPVLPDSGPARRLGSSPLSR